MAQNTKKHKYPEIEFKVDKEHEKEVFWYFFEKNPEYFDRFIKGYPDLKKVKDLPRKESEKFLNKRLNEIYKVAEPELIKKKKEIEVNWNKVKNNFFKETERIFKHKWPSGEYIAYISIFGMYRLKPGTKDFSIPSEDYSGNPPTFGHINFVIMHEMIHILFEDFYNTYFNVSRLPLKDYYSLLEVTTTIILNLPEIKKISKWVSYPYPKHKELYERLKKVYEENRNIKEFVKKSIEFIFHP